MKRQNKEAYHFLKIEKNQYLLSWIAIFPLYFYGLKNIFIIPLARTLSWDVTSEVFLSLAALVRNGIILIAIIFLFRQYIAQSVEEIRQHRFKHTLCWLGRGLGYFLIANIVNGLVYVCINQMAGDRQMFQSTRNQVMVDAFYASHIVLSLLSNVIIAPIVEEFIFRVILFHTLRRFHAAAAILGSSLVFGVLHVFYELAAGDWRAFIYVIPYMGTAVALALLYEKRRNIILCIMLHMLLNLISLIL